MRLLISHSAKDAALVRVFHELLKKASLNRLDVWHTSDTSETGGLVPGDIWYNRIIQQLRNTEVVIVVVTPNSIDSGWIYFEAGFVAALSNTKVIPVVLGYRIDEVGTPLSGYQIYNIAQSADFLIFIRKIFGIADIPYVDEVHSGMIQKYFSEIKEIESKIYVSGAKDAAQDLERTLDTAVLRIEKTISALIGGSKFAGLSNSSFALFLPVYREESDSLVSQVKIVIEQGWTLGRLLDECYYSISGFVSPYKYLEEWIIRDQVSQTNLVTLGAALLAPAAAFFQPEGRYEIIILNNPYEPELDHHAYPQSFKIR